MERLPLNRPEGWGLAVAAALAWMAAGHPLPWPQAAGLPAALLAGWVCAASVSGLVEPPAEPSHPPSRARQLLHLAAALAGASALLAVARGFGRLAALVAPLLPLGWVVGPPLRHYPQARAVVCGLAQLLACGWVWVAVRGTMEGPGWLYGAAAASWLAGSVLMADPAPTPAADEDETAGQGQRWHATGLPRGRLRLAGAAFAAAATLWVMAGWAAGRSGWYFAGVGLAALLLAWRYRRLARQARRPAASAGRVDGLVAVSVAGATVLDVVRDAAGM